MKNKLICILGKSASGKSTVEKELTKHGVNKVISYTTRPIREGEIQGHDYWFIDDAIFKVYLNQKQFYEYTTYNNWYYGINKNDIELSKSNYVAVIEPHGYEQLIHNLGRENIIGIYLTVNDKEKLLRALTREINPNVNEIVRRYSSDIELFKGIEDKVDLVIENNDLQETVSKILEFISKE